MKTNIATVARPLNVIAAEISHDWVRPNYAAAPYLDAMLSLNRISDSYGADGGGMIVLYFLSNASSWKGDTAKRIKKELNKIVRDELKRK
jgi:hypothetical protein